MSKNRIPETTLNSAKALEEWCQKMRQLEKEYYLELAWAADQLQHNLSSLQSTGIGGVPLVGAPASRVRAKLVADNIRRAAEAHKYSGGQIIRTWKAFVKHYAPEIEHVKNKQRNVKPTFTID